jgi:CheY-like chemotaxis protein
MDRPTIVLLVDDSPEDRFLTARALAKTGLQTINFEAEDGSEAIDFLRHTGRFSDPQAFPRPDLILLDLKMPGVNGFDFLQWFRDQAFDIPAKVVIVSGSELERDLEMARELGAVAYLTKPPTPHQLRDLILSLFGVAASRG